MVVTIHQPHYLPWLGYLHRMAHADLFVLLDHVQFERGNYQNRTMIRMSAGGGAEKRWLTLPVVQRSQKEAIADKLIDHSPEVLKKHFLTLRHAYREAGFFGHYLGELRALYEASWERLVDLNDASLALLREAFGIRTPLVKSSTLGVRGAKGELILEVCRAVGADTLLAGLGGSRGYLDREAFARAGVNIVYQEFTHPRYAQCGAGEGAGEFIPGLTALDMLFNCGPESRRLLLENRTEARVAA